MKNQKMLPWLYLALGLTQAGHSVEEILTSLWKNLPVATGLIHTRLPFFPVLQWSAEGFAVANLIIVAVLLGFSPFPFINHAWAWKTAGVVAFIEILNGVLHLSGAIILGRYFSGSVSAAALLTLGMIILWQRRNNRGY